MRFRLAAGVPNPHRPARRAAATVVAMVRSRSLESPDVVVARLDGLVTSEDQAEIVGFIRGATALTGSVRLLVLLDRFAGWILNGSFDRDWLWLRDDEVSAIAIVVASAWRGAVQTVITQPLRNIPIEFFETETDARQWLKGRAVRQPL